MRTRCISINNPASLEQVSNHPFIVVGHDYVVLELIANPGGRIKVHILGDDLKPGGWWDSQMFATIDSSIPRNWVCVVGDLGILEIGPTLWMRPGFWEDYYNGEAHAATIFERERSIILEASNC